MAPPAVEKVETPEELEGRLRRLMTQSIVVLFMKGSPDEPRCGFSRKICGLLRDNKIEFSHFDILTDESVRQGEFVSIRPHISRGLMMPHIRSKETQRLAYVPTAYCKRRLCWGAGYRPRDG
jgi:hypothetical protein